MSEVQTPVARVVAVCVGRIQALGVKGHPDPLEREWTTAFFKTPVEGAVEVGNEGVEGDHQYERRYHGGPEMAVLMYGVGRYAQWKLQAGLEAMGPGGFGENFPVTGLDEATVCLGDTFAVGDEVVVQVSQPRGPCSKIEKRWKCPGILKQVVENGWTGWYLRVVKTGKVKAGDEVKLLERPYPNLTIERVNTLIGKKKSNPALAAEIAACELAAPEYRAGFK